VAARSREHLSGGGVGHRTGDGHAVDLHPDRHRVGAKPVHEVHGAVDGVEHPHRHAGGRPRRTTLLLAQDRVVRSQHCQALAQQPLGLGVDDGHRIGRAALGAHRAVVLLRTGENLGAPPADEGGGLGRQLLGECAQCSRCGATSGFACCHDTYRSTRG